MSLERNQLLHNKAIVTGSRASASLNPKQAPHDANELLTKGAEQVAAGRTLGLSEEEVLAAVSREYRRQKRQDQSVTMQDVERQMAQASNSLSGGLESPEVRGVRYEEDPGVDPFGEDQSDYQNFSADDRGYTTDEDSGELIREPYESKAEDIAPKSALRDALEQLESGASQYGYDAFPGSAAVAGRLEDSLPDSGAENAAQKALAAELVARDSSRFDPEVQEYNNYRAEAEASAIGRNFTAGGAGTMADEAIGRIGEVRSLGKANQTAQVIRYAGDSSSFPEAKNMNGIYVDPRTGQPIAVQETIPDALAGSNTPNTANQLNAPTRESSTEFVARRAPGYREGGRVFGDYPQIDITGATTLFADRVRGLEAGGFEKASQMPADIRSIDEFDRTINMIREEGLKRGKKFYNQEQVDGGVKSKRTTDPGPEAVLNFLRYTPAEAEQLAGALYQLDSARRSSVNQNPDSMYFTRTGPRGSMEGVMFDSPEAIDPRDGAAQVAKFTRGERIEGKQVSEALRGLSPEAAMPFKGEVAGEKQPIIRQTKVPTASSPGRKGPEFIRQVRAARGQDQTPEDINETRRMQVNNIVAEERAKRDASERQQLESDIIARRGKAPKQTKVYGSGDMQRQVEDDAREQSRDMQLSDLISSIRRRRG